MMQCLMLISLTLQISNFEDCQKYNEMHSEYLMN